MDIALSILTGLGLRSFMFNNIDARSLNVKLTTALLGLWEGAVVHQISARSSSSNIDHLLAYGLRLAVDLLITKNIQRMVMVVLWSALGTLAAELIMPYESLRAALKKEREHDREKERRRRSRSTAAPVPVISTPLPPRIRAYKPPESSQITPTLPETPPPQSSTPLFPLERLPSPPSFFLQETNPSPSPKHVFIHMHESQESSPPDALPVRPRSGLASMLDNSPPDSGSPLPIPMHLPTPPDSAQSAIPSDGPLNDSQGSETLNDKAITRFPEHQLYTIPEQSSPEDNATPESNADNPIENTQPETIAMFVHPIASVPVPDSGMKHLPSSNMAKWLTSQYGDDGVDPEAIFTTPFSPSMSPVPPIPVRIRAQDLAWQNRTPTHDVVNLHDEADELQDDDGGLEYVDPPQPAEDSDSDELQTPGLRHLRDIDTDNEHDSDLLRTPKQLRQEEEDGQLSPLGINLGRVMDEDGYGASRGFGPASTTALDGVQAVPDVEQVLGSNEDFPMPGSLLQNALLEPPLPPSGPLFTRPFPPPDSPPPPSPSTIHSDPSDASVLSTNLPTRLYEHADELRKRARDEENRRAQLEEQRRRAEMEGRIMDALQLKISVREMDAEAYKLHEKAARRYFVARNPLPQPSKIDVHGLRPREAFDRIERAIVQASQMKKKAVYVIVGKGLHSVNQQPTLKPAVMREMQRLKLKCDVHPRNPGQLIITLPTS